MACPTKEVAMLPRCWNLFLSSWRRTASFCRFSYRWIKVSTRPKALMVCMCWKISWLKDTFLLANSWFFFSYSRIFRML